MIAPAIQTVWAIYKDAAMAGEAPDLWAELVVGWNENGEALVIDDVSGSGVKLCRECPAFWMLVPDVCRRTHAYGVRCAISIASCGSIDEAWAVPA